MWTFGSKTFPVFSRVTAGEEIVSIKLFAMTCGWLTGELGRLLEGGEGEAELPIPSYLIEHPRGTALFDTGLHPACQHDPAARVGPRLSTLFRFNYHPGEEISARLAALRSPRSVSATSEHRRCLLTLSARFKIGRGDRISHRTSGK